MSSKLYPVMILAIVIVAIWGTFVMLKDSHGAPQGWGCAISTTGK